MMPSTDKKRKILDAVISALFWLGVWTLAAYKVGQELILPSPVSVVRTLFELAGTGDFWMSTLTSLWRVLMGFLCGVAAGTVLAALIVCFKPAEILLSPILRIMRATPVASFIIIALLWIGKSRVPGFIAALMAAPVVCAAVETAIRQTNGELLEMANVYRFSFFKKLKLIYIPSVLPSWISSCVTVMGLAWKSGVAAEVLCQPANAVGSELYYSKIYLETPSLFAWTTVVILMSYILEKVFVLLTDRREKHDKDR